MGEGPKESSLHELLRAGRAEIIADWERSVSQRSPGRELSWRRLRDHMPDLIDALALAAERAELGQPAHVPSTAVDLHTTSRLDEGYDLRELAEEYAILRQCILRHIGRFQHTDMRLVELLNETVDRAVIGAVTRFHDAHSRTLTALDRLSREALAESGSLDDFLTRLVSVLVETTEAVDEATILLRDRDRLFARASVGLESSVAEGWSVADGEGFAGRVAAGREPISLSGPTLEQTVLNVHIRERGYRTLYGIPLLHGEDLLGVAHMASRTADEFSMDDRQLLRAMAHRASALIAQYRLAQRLRASEARLQGIVDEAPVWIFVKDAPDLRYSLANRAFAETFGKTTDELRGKTDEEVFASMPAEMRELARARDLRVLETGEVLPHENTVPIGDTTRTLLFQKFPLREDSGAPYAVGTVATDITDRKRIDEARERFIGILGHDLRNPLSAITMGAAALAASDLDAEDEKLVAQIENSAHRMERMILEVLDFARARLGGGIPVEAVPVNLEELLRHLLKEHQMACPEQRIELEIFGDLRGQWDRERIAQVISNLLSNAIEHGVGVVRVVARDEGAWVAIEVHNRGEPIPREKLEWLFEPFRRGREDEGRKTRGLGLGLGLFIVNEIVRAHRGSIRVESDERGTMFRIVLPRAS